MIPMPPENIRRISVFGLGHRFLPGTRNSHFSRPVTAIFAPDALSGNLLVLLRNMPFCLDDLDHGIDVLLADFITLGFNHHADLWLCATLTDQNSSALTQCVRSRFNRRLHIRIVLTVGLCSVSTPYCSSNCGYPQSISMLPPSAFTVYS